MKTPNKTEDEKGRSAATTFAKKQSMGESSSQFIDNRPETVMQRKLQEIAAQKKPSLSLTNAGPIQMVKAGNYITTKECHLRKDKLGKGKIATIEKGASITVLPGAPTKKFSSGIIHKKDHTWVKYGNDEGWIVDEALASVQRDMHEESSSSEEAPQVLSVSPPSRATSSPMGIQGRSTAMAIPGKSGARGKTGRNRRVRAPQVASSLEALPDIDEKEKYPSIEKQNVASSKVKLFNQAFKIYTHFTKEEHRENIHAKGLIAGEGEGIGLPVDPDGKSKERGDGDPNNIYVLSGSNRETTNFVTKEAGPAPVVIISRHGTADQDVNYKFDTEGHIGAYKFSNSIPSAKGATGGEKEISIVWPPSSSAKTGLVNFLNRGIQDPNNQFTEAEALFLVAQKLVTVYGIHFHSYENLR